MGFFNLKDLKDRKLLLSDALVGGSFLLSGPIDAAVAVMGASVAAIGLYDNIKKICKSQPAMSL